MELDLPDRASVHVCEGVRDGGVHEVPELDATVTARSEQMGASRVEINSRDPVAMTLTGHDILCSVHVPDLPCAVIGGGCNDLLALMQSHATDASRVSIYRINSRKAVSHRLVCLGEEGIRSSVFRHSRVLCRALAESALLEKGGLINLSGGAQIGALTLVLSFDLSLNFLLIRLDLTLEHKSLLLQLVLLKLEQGLLLGGVEQLLLDFLDLILNLFLI